MGLATDSIFIQALTASSELMDTIGSRLYGTAIPLPDEDIDNVPLPYIIVTFDGLNNDAQTKDNTYEGEFDVVNIGVEVVAESLTALHELAQKVRDTILTYMTTEDTPILDYQFSAQAIQYDSLKPCYWQTLTYQCDVEIQNEEDNE
jgi:hypothetical protein